jgi:hypothetical protein
MHKAIECETKFGKDGKPVTRKWSVGPILIWGIVALVLGLAGKAIISPSILSLSQSSKRPQAGRPPGLTLQSEGNHYVSHGERYILFAVGEIADGGRIHAFVTGEIP